VSITRVLLDGNIYDKLKTDENARTTLSHLISHCLVRVIATPMIIAELQKSPFGGLPGWFPVDVNAENVTVLGYAPLGMTRLGDGTVYAEHRGESNKIPDGIIADSADALADVFVSEDRRCRERLKRKSVRCSGMDYQEFRIWMEQLISTE
jgi:hypothetical protein